MPVRKISDIPLEEVKAGKGTRRQILIDAKEAPNFALRRFVMDPGGGIPNHTNTVEHEQYVLGGRLFFFRKGNVRLQAPHLDPCLEDEGIPGRVFVD